MHTLTYQHTQGDTTIFIEDHLIQSHLIAQHAMSLGHHFVIVTDDNVCDQYAVPLAQTLKNHHQHCLLITIPAGEAQKNRETKASIENQMLEAQCGRDTVLIAVGGGVVSDIAGFVASTYCRGIPSIYVPTTLLAMVDAAIGGKTGVNTPEGKNLIGSFHQPRYVFCDPNTLSSLPHDEIANGMVESLKHALIKNPTFFDEINTLLDNHSDLRSVPSEQWASFIATSCQIKCDIISLDEKEQGGARQLLNFGHTVGHAIEQELHYKISHGQAVLIGMRIASDLSYQLGHLSNHDLSLIKATLEKIQYHHCATLQPEQIPQLLDYMQLDKKSINKEAHFVILKTMGDAYCHNNRYSFPVQIDVISQAIHDHIKEQS